MGMMFNILNLKQSILSCHQFIFKSTQNCSYKFCPPVYVAVTKYILMPLCPIIRAINLTKTLLYSHLIVYLPTCTLTGRLHICLSRRMRFGIAVGQPSGTNSHRVCFSGSILFPLIFNRKFCQIQNFLLIAFFFQHLNMSTPIFWPQGF